MSKPKNTEPRNTNSDETVSITPTLHHRAQQNLTVRQFADAINKKLINTYCSFSKVSRWENGEYEPSLNLLFECIATYPGTWQAQWAVDEITHQFPDLIQSGVITFKLPEITAQ